MGEVARLFLQLRFAQLREVCSQSGYGGLDQGAGSCRSLCRHRRRGGRDPGGVDPFDAGRRLSFQQVHTLGRQALLAFTVTAALVMADQAIHVRLRGEIKTGVFPTVADMATGTTGIPGSLRARRRTGPARGRRLRFQTRGSRKTVHDSWLSDLCRGLDHHHPLEALELKSAPRPPSGCAGGHNSPRAPAEWLSVSTVS